MKLYPDLPMCPKHYYGVRDIDVFPCPRCGVTVEIIEKDKE
jgi:hypothetical protein